MGLHSSIGASFRFFPPIFCQVVFFPTDSCSHWQKTSKLHLLSPSLVEAVRNQRNVLLGLPFITKRSGPGNGRDANQRPASSPTSLSTTTPFSRSGTTLEAARDRVLIEFLPSFPSVILFFTLPPPPPQKFWNSWRGSYRSLPSLYRVFQVIYLAVT